MRYPAVLRARGRTPLFEGTFEAVESIDLVFDTLCGDRRSQKDAGNEVPAPVSRRKTVTTMQEELFLIEISCRASSTAAVRREEYPSGDKSGKLS